MNIILYNRGIRNYLIYNKILKQNSKLIDIVIEMSALPHSSKSKKISLSKILEMFINCPQFVIMHFLVVSMFPVTRRAGCTHLNSKSSKESEKSSL